MPTDKMLRVLSFLNDIRVKGTVVSAGHEVAIELNGQLPTKEDHDWMLSKGFVFEDYMYVYRP